jgi:hypothetical protein
VRERAGVDDHRVEVADLEAVDERALVVRLQGIEAVAEP